MGNFKILFITDRFLPTPTANTINTQKIINEMRKRGHKITCIAVNQDETDSVVFHNTIPVYSIKSTWYGRLLQLSKENRLGLLGRITLKCLVFIRKIKNALSIYKFPNVDPSQSKDVLKLVDKLYKQEGFDCVIGVFRPFSGVSAAISMKRKYPTLLCGAYYLDLISGSTKPSFVPNNLYKKLCYKGETKTFNELDFILMAKGGESTYSDSKYNRVNAKINYIDFPLFNIENGKHSIDYDKSKINLVYAGTLDKNYRNPIHMLRLVEKASKQINGIVLHLFGRGNCGSIIKEYKDRGSFQIIEHGMVPYEYVKSAMQQADFLINISNSTQNIVPSKIFELFSTGKPILNFVSNKNDISKEYFNKYPAVCLIAEWEDVEKQMSFLKEFIIKEKGNCYPVEGLKEKYLQNTPEFTVNIIEEYLRINEEKD